MVDVRSSDGGQFFGFREAVCDGHMFFIIVAVDFKGVIGVELTLGEVVGDGDGDGTGVVDVDIGYGLNGAVEPDDLELRDGLEGVSPGARGGEIVRGGYCEGIRLNRGRKRNPQLQSLPLCLVARLSPAWMTTQLSLER